MYSIYRRGSGLQIVRWTYDHVSGLPRLLVRYDIGDLDETRQHMPEGMVQVPRQSFDPNTLLETWVERA